MRIIAFITEPSTVRQILEHLGEAIRPPRIAPARGPPLWAVAAANQAGNDPAWDLAAQPVPAVEFDQRISWCGATSAARWVRLGGRRNERGILGLDLTKPGRYAQGSGDARIFSRSGR
jgi:hypothetical protein